MKIIKFLFLFGTLTLFINIHGLGQANPTISVFPTNSGLVAVGATLDLQIDIGNTGLSSIPLAKLRPIIAIPASVTFLPTIEQTGLPPGWSILTNSGSQLRFCNTSFVIPPLSVNIIILKVRGVSISPPQTFSGQINFGNGTTCAAGPTVAGNNLADDNATSTIQVVPGCNLGITATAGTILCNDGTTSITATATAATGPVEYSITGAASFQASNIFSNLAAGTYNVTVREVNNPTTCIISTAVTITEPPAIQAPAVNITQPTCTNLNAVVIITTSTNGLSFSVDGGAFAPYPAGGFSLSAGSHSVVARNANDCTSPTTTFNVNTQPVTPQTPAIAAVTQPDCVNNTGSVVLNNLPAGTWVIEPGNITGNTGSTTINNLAAGAYSFTVTNDVGCTSVATSSVNIIAVVGVPDAPTVTLIQPTCTTATGIITITSPIAGLVFSLDAGSFAPYPTGGYTGIMAGSHTLVAQNISGCLSPVTNITINIQPASPTAPVVNVTQPNCTVATGNITITSDTTGITFSLDGGTFAPYPVAGYIVSTGIHSLAVQNSSGCAPNITDNIVVNAQPVTPSLTAVFTPITCFGGNTVITANASGGVFPYEYSLNGSAFQSANVFTTNAGTYIITVKDANGCIGNSNSIIIAQKAAISATASASPIACNGGNATITISATGGLGTYEYSLNSGTYQLGNTFNVLSGTYNVNVRLANNPACSTAVNTTLNVPQPNVLKVTATANAISFCGGNTIAKISSTGGTPPYSGTGDFVKGPGKFNFIVVDANGCTSAVDLFIIPPGCVDIKVFPNPAKDLITVNHSVAVGSSTFLQIFAENGSKIFNYNVPQNNFTSTLNISALAGGSYILVYINDGERKTTRFIKTNK